jgi:hypothetical protein
MQRRCVVLAMALLCSACGAQISDGTSASAGPDADPGGGGPEIDAGPGDAAAPGCTSRSVYLSFEGETLVRGRSDATTNRAEWMTIDQGTAPRYLAAHPGRAAIIEAIVDGVRRQLAQFPISVVTTRPTSGEYVMVVFGGRASHVGSDFGGAVNQLDCDDSRPNDVAWVSDLLAPTQLVINATIGAIGFGVGLTATSNVSDCMCGWANDCEYDLDKPCTLGSPIARDPRAQTQCIGVAPQQDEVAAIRGAFCR